MLLLLNFQFVTGVLLARETPVLLDGSEPNAEWSTTEKKNALERDPKGSDQRQRIDTPKVSRQYARPLF